MKKKPSDRWTRLLAQLGNLPRKCRLDPPLAGQAAQFEVPAACCSPDAGG